MGDLGIPSGKGKFRVPQYSWLPLPAKGPRHQPPKANANGGRDKFFAAVFLPVFPPHSDKHGVSEASKQSMQWGDSVFSYS
jgi:hypothetical protein